MLIFYLNTSMLCIFMQSESAIIRTYRILFIIGCILAFSSCFIDWYYVQYFNEMGQVVLSCSYHVFLGWNVFDRIYGGALEQFYPISPPLALEFMFLYFGLMVSSIYIAVFKNPNLMKGKNPSQYASYILLATTFMTIIMISYFTYMLLENDGMHVPSLIINDQIFEVVIYQSVGIGFIIQAAAFLFMFPFAWIHFRLQARFEIVRKDQVVNGTGGINLDRLIAEEIVHANSKQYSRNPSNSRRTMK